LSSSLSGRKAVPQYFPGQTPTAAGQDISQSQHPIPLGIPPIPGPPQTVIDPDLGSTPYLAAMPARKRTGSTPATPLTLPTTTPLPTPTPTPLAAPASATDAGAAATGVSRISVASPLVQANHASLPTSAGPEGAARASSPHLAVDVRSTTPVLHSPLTSASNSSTAFLGNAPHPMLAGRQSVSGTKLPPTFTPTSTAASSPPSAHAVATGMARSISPLVGPGLSEPESSTSFSLGTAAQSQHQKTSKSQSLTQVQLRDGATNGLVLTTSTSSATTEATASTSSSSSVPPSKPNLAIRLESQTLTDSISTAIQAQIAAAKAASAAAAANAAAALGHSQVSSNGAAGAPALRLQLPEGSTPGSIPSSGSHGRSFAHLALDQTLDQSFEISKNGTIYLMDPTGNRQIAINMQGDLRVNDHTFVPNQAAATGSIALGLTLGSGFSLTSVHQPLAALPEGRDLRGGSHGEGEDDDDCDSEGDLTDTRSVTTSTSTTSSASTAHHGHGAHARHGTTRHNARKEPWTSRNVTEGIHEYDETICDDDAPEEDGIRALRSPGAASATNLSGNNQGTGLTSGTSRRPVAPLPQLPSAVAKRNSLSNIMYPQTGGQVGQPANGGIASQEEKGEQKVHVGAQPHKIRSADLVMLGRLGKGASAVVRQMLYAPDFTIYAVKTIPLFDDALRQYLKSELHVLTGVRHPHLLRLLGCYSEDANITLVLEHMNRGDLQGWLEPKSGSESGTSGTTLCEAALRIVAKGVLHGLHALHAKNHIHRDLKPANILLSSDGGVKLADFGLIKKLEKEKEFTVAQGGTIAYLSPERLFENRVYPSGDVWSLGLTLVVAATGAMPVPTEYWSLDVFMRQDETKMPFDLDPKIYSAKMRDFVRLALRKDPLKRPSAAELLTHPWIATPHATTFQPWYLTPQQLEAGLTRADLSAIEGDIAIPSDPDVSLVPWRALKTPSNSQVLTLLEALTGKHGPWRDRMQGAAWQPEDARRMRYVAKQMGWRWDDLLAALTAKLGSSFQEAAVAAAIGSGL